MQNSGTQNGFHLMTNPKASKSRSNDRRSRLDRRWIKAKYQGEERRSGKDRRSEISLQDINRDLPVPKKSESKKMVGLEKLTVSNTIQLEVITRLLLKKGIIEENELMSMMKTVQMEYQDNQQT
jgi:hypothetical protein